MLEVFDHETGVKKVIGFDWADSPRLIYKKKLSKCDIYYKRNFIPEDISRNCPADLQNKIKPLGPTYGCRSRREPPLWVRLIGACYHDESVNFQLRTFLKDFRKFIGYARTSRYLVEENYFYPSSNVQKKPIILFHTRAYDAIEEHSAHDSEVISNERAEIIRVLRNEFGGRVIAGFIPGRYAIKAYPDLVLDKYLSHPEYIDLLKSASVCVYSRGLNDSPAFKLTEYLAAGKCILSQKIPTVFPKALENMKELVYFDSMDHMVSLCHTLLDSTELREHLEQNAFNYYFQEVKPATCIMKILEDTFREGK